MSRLSAVDMEEGEDATNRITLMTIHYSKGLEFPYVYVAGMEENIFPSGGSMASENDIEEERRLFYVAMTRAKKSVQLSFATTRMRNGKHESNSPSRFIREIDSRYILNPLGESAEDSGGEFSGSPAWSRQGSARPFSNPGYSSGTQGRQGGFPGYSYGRSGNVRQVATPGKGPAAAASGGSRTIIPSRKPAATVVPPRPDAEFEPTPILQLKAGQRVEHNRFGFGKIIEITGGPSDLKAKISFDDYGDKILLLKYAKIRVVKD